MDQALKSKDVLRRVVARLELSKLFIVPNCREYQSGMSNPQQSPVDVWLFSCSEAAGVIAASCGCRKR